MKRRRIGNGSVRLGKRIVSSSALMPVADCTGLWQANDLMALRRNLDQDGFIFIRGLIPESDVLEARHLLLKTSEAEGSIAEGTDYRRGTIASDRRGRLVQGYTVDAKTGRQPDDRDHDVEGWQKIGTSPTMRSVYDGKVLSSFLAKLFGGDDMFENLPDYTWLRLKSKGDITVEHADYYYFRRSTDLFTHYQEPVSSDTQCPICSLPATEPTIRSCQICRRPFHYKCIPKASQLPVKQTWLCTDCADGPIAVYTCWIALSDISIDDSTLAFVPKSHKLHGFDSAHGTQQTPLEYRANPAAERYHIAQKISPGDVFVFNIKTIHCASENRTGRFRVSIDTRLQLTPKGRKNWLDINK